MSSIIWAMWSWVMSILAKPSIKLSMGMMPMCRARAVGLHEDRPAVPPKADAAIQNAHGFFAFQHRAEPFNGKGPKEPQFDHSDFDALLTLGVHNGVSRAHGAARSHQNDIGVIAAVGFDLAAILATEGIVKQPIDLIPFALNSLHGGHVFFAEFHKPLGPCRGRRSPGCSGL